MCSNYKGDLIISENLERKLQVTVTSSSQGRGDGHPLYNLEKSKIIKKVQVFSLKQTCTFFILEGSKLLKKY